MRTASRPRRRPAQPHLILKPHGAIHPRVKQAEPHHFGIVCVDCAKARSKWMLADFYGEVLLPPAIVEHSRDGFQAALQALQQARADHQLRDLIVAVERTGRYHHSVKRAFTEAGFEVRIVHPFATKQYRQPADPGYKTDDTDLAAIHRAAVNGFGLLEPQTDPRFVELQLLARHRRDLVAKAAALRCQILEHLHAMLPGYATCFSDVFNCKYAIAIACEFHSAAAIAQAGVAGLHQRLQAACLQHRATTLQVIVSWARTAPGGDAQAATHARILAQLDADHAAKIRDVAALEQALAALLVRTPYVLLLVLPGINVVSAAEFAGEMGPIAHYPRARAITGRAGLYPARYQSDRVDLPDGPLIRCANRALRRAILMIADNLIACNGYFGGLAARWRSRGKDARDIRVKVGDRFCRIAYQLVAGRQPWQHPSCRDRAYVLKKLNEFYNAHLIDIARTIADLEAAAEHLPQAARAAEAASLAEELAGAGRGRGAGPRRLGEILPAVLLKLGVHTVESSSSGEPDLT